MEGLIEGHDILKIGIVRRIGNGNTSHIWDMNWLPRKENMRPIVALKSDPPMMLAELIDRDNA